MYGHTHYFGSSHISEIHLWHWAPPLCIYRDKLLGGGFFHVWKSEQNTGEKIMLLLVSWRKHLPNNPRQIMSILPMLSQHWPTLRPLSKEWCVCRCARSPHSCSWEWDSAVGWRWPLALKSCVLTADVSEGSQRSTIHTACHIVFRPLRGEFHLLITR